MTSFVTVEVVFDHIADVRNMVVENQFAGVSKKVLVKGYANVMQLAEPRRGCEQ